MATGGERRPTFKDFYGDIESEELQMEASGLDETVSGQDFTDRPGRSDESKDAGTCSSPGQSNNFDVKNNGNKSKASGGGATPGKSKVSNEGKSKTSDTGDAYGKGKTFSKNGFSEKKSKASSSDRDSSPVGHSFHMYTEYSGGPQPRQYRRAKFVAQKMSIECCEDGAKVKRTEGDELSEPTTVCNWCRKTSPEPLKRCARCLAVSYCDKECQRAGFGEHRLFCRRCDRYDIARARVYPAVRFFLDLNHARHYSTLLNDMPTEDQYRRGAWCNLLVEVMGQIPHFRRYIFLVRDLSGLVRKVVFHDETNVYVHPSLNVMESLPKGLASSLIPGHFLLLIGVAWRNFHDGTVGIRVNDLASVYVINMADHRMSKEYKEDVEFRVSIYDDSPRRPRNPFPFFI